MSMSLSVNRTFQFQCSHVLIAFTPSCHLWNRKETLRMRLVWYMTILSMCTQSHTCIPIWWPPACESKALWSILWLKLRLQKWCFTWNGDVIFFKIVASPVRGKNRLCSYPRTEDATAEKNRRKKSGEIQWVEFFATKSWTLSLMPKFVTKCSHHSVPAMWQFSKKLHHHRKQKIAHVATALKNLFIWFFSIVQFTARCYKLTNSKAIFLLSKPYVCLGNHLIDFQDSSL